VRLRLGGIALAVALAGAALAVHPPPAPGIPFRDFEAYYAAGATWRYHGDPYGRDVWRVEKTIPGVVAARDELLPFVGPPFGLPLWSAFSQLPWPRASESWGIVLALAFATFVAGSVRAAGRLVPIDVLAALIAGACFGPLTSGIALGQVAIVACAAIASVPLLLVPRMALAAAAAALAAGLQPNLALVLATQADGRRAIIALVTALAVAIGGSAVALGGVGGFAHYFEVLREHAAAERFIAIQTTVAAVARGLGAPAGMSAALAIAIAIVAIVAVALQARSGRYGPSERLALGCAALPLALPFAHEHDFAIAFLPAIVVARRARGGTWVAGACAAVAIGVDWLGLAQRPNELESTALLAAAVAVGIAMLAPQPLRAFHAAPLAVAVAVVPIGRWAAAHPLPTWPNQLASHLAFAHGSAAEVWRAEQLASGIGGLDPAWALLRALSLGACALLWGAGTFALLTSREAMPRSAPSSIPLRRPPATYPSV